MVKVKTAKNKVGVWDVLLDKKIVGEIRHLFDEDKFQYFPKGQKEGGEKLNSLNAVINSLCED